jgi:hypothetical protein
LKRALAILQLLSARQFQLKPRSTLGEFQANDRFVADGAKRRMTVGGARSEERITK